MNGLARWTIVLAGTAALAAGGCGRSPSTTGGKLKKEAPIGTDLDQSTEMQTDESGGGGGADAGGAGGAEEPVGEGADAGAAGEESGAAYVLRHTMTTIEGEPADLSAYEGRVVVFVNVASRCGLTPQYAELEALYEKYRDRGLVVLGFPANDFGGQEPGTDAEILEFCTGEYGVSFPMFSKISVIGEDRHPLYAQLAEATGAEPSWNFTKYVVDRQGRVAQRFDPRVKPSDPAFVSEVEALLGAG